MLIYRVKRTEDPEKFDVSHDEDAYDGRFSRSQLRSFVEQLLAEGHQVLDDDRHCELDGEHVDRMSPDGYEEV